jgi:hypothetical protein
VCGSGGWAWGLDFSKFFTRKLQQLCGHDMPAASLQQLRKPVLRSLQQQHAEHVA